MHWRRLRVDRGHPAARNARTQMEAHLAAGTKDRADAADHAATEVWNADDYISAIVSAGFRDFAALAADRIEPWPFGPRKHLNHDTSR